MLALAKRLVGGLALISGCTGTIGGVTADFSSDDDDAVEEDDAGHGRVTTVPRDDRPDARTSSSSSPRDAGRKIADDGGVAPSTEHSVTDVCGAKVDLPLASGLRIREISLYQTVKSPLYKDGAWVSARSIPVVQGKQALVRVFVDPLPGYTRHAVRAVLTLQDGKESAALEDRKTIEAKSTDAALDSTFDFMVPGEKLGASTELSLALHELECDATAGSAKEARVPEQGTTALGAASTGALKVVVVPVSINGRLPPTGDAELEKMRAYLLSYYPVAKVELSVRTRPIVWNTGLRGTDGRSWSSLLNQVVVERRTDNPGSDVYYFGLVQPTETFRAYCGGGCILGIAPQTTRVMPSMQVGLGASFGDAQSYETMVHELGHAHGRGHAPCAIGGNIQGVDSGFPDRSGATAAWGWDARTNRLMAPTSKDIMGYCQPNWISAYTYVGLAERSTAVNARAFIAGSPTTTRWQQLIVHADGSAQWGGALETSEPAGEIARSTVRDAAGRAIAEVDVVRIPLGDSDDAFVFIPEPAQGWSTLTIGGRTIALSDVAPAR